MKKRITLFAYIILSAGRLLADVVVFENGDSLTGTVVERNAEFIRFNSSFIGEITIPLNGIKEVVCSEETHVDQTKHSPKQIAEEKTGIVVENTETTIDLLPPESAQQVATEKVDQPWNWSGKIGFGYASRESDSVRRTGNNTFQRQQKENDSIRFFGTIATSKDKNHLNWDWTYRYSKSDIRKNDDFLEIYQIYRRDISERYFARTKTSYQQDYLRDIEQERLQTAELGVTLIDSPTIKLGASGGGAVQYYERDESNYSNTNGKLVFDQNLRWKLNDIFTLYENYSHLGNLEDYRLVFTGGIENQLIDDLFIKLEYRLDRDTDVMYDDKTFYDKALTTSLLYKF